MKTKLIILLCILFSIELYGKETAIFSQSESEQLDSDTSGWLEKNGYLEQKNQIDITTFIRLSKDNKHFYTFGKTGIFRKWDIETGKLVIEYKLPINNTNISSFDLYSDEETMAVAECIEMNKYNKITILNRDSIILEYTPYDGSDFYLLNNNVLFNPIEGKLNTFTNVNDIQDGGKYYYHSSNSFKNQIDMKTYQIEKFPIDIGNPIELIFSSDYKKLIEYGHDYSYCSPGENPNSPRWDKMYINTFDTETGDKKELFFVDYESSISNLTFSNNNEHFIYCVHHYYYYDYYYYLGDTIYNFNIKNNNLRYKFHESIRNNIVFTKDDKYLITQVVNNGKSYLRFRASNNTEIQSEFELVSIYHAGKLSTTFDNTSLLMAGNDGYIRIYKPDILSKELKSLFYVDSLEKRQEVEFVFTDVSNGNPTSWLWDFGDGQYSNEQNPKHWYQDTGLYTVKLIVQKENKTDTLVKINYIKVIPVLVAEFEADNTVGSKNHIVKFTNKSEGIYNAYLWEFGDGKTSNEEHPTHIYYNKGIYDITLYIMDGKHIDTIIKKEYILVLDYEKEKSSLDTIWSLRIQPYRVDDIEFSYDSKTIFYDDNSNQIKEIFTESSKLFTGYNFVDYENFCLHPNKKNILLSKGFEGLYMYSLNSNDSELVYKPDLYDKKYDYDFIPYDYKINNYVLKYLGNTGKILCSINRQISYEEQIDYDLWAKYGDYSSNIDIVDMNKPNTYKTLKKFFDEHGFVVYQDYIENKQLIANYTVYIFTNDNNSYASYNYMIMDTSGQELIKKEKITNGIRGVQFDKTGDNIYIGLVGGDIYKMPINKYEFKDTLVDFKSELRSMKLSKNGNYLIVSLANGYVYLYDILSNCICDSAKLPYPANKIVLSPDSSHFAIASEDGIIWLFKSDFLSSVEENINQITTNTDTHLCYPNPFTDDVTISYTLSEKSKVRVSIYNNYGQEIALLKDCEEEVGNHNINYNPKCLPIGIYYYKLQINNIVKTGKLVKME